MKNILMNVEMTKAILDGRKVQTRRVAKGKNRAIDIFEVMLKNKDLIDVATNEFIKRYSKYQIGETIWVREPAKVINVNDYQDCFTAEYLADGEQVGIMYLDRWLNDDGLTVPKWVEKCQGIPNGCIKEMARIFLKVTNVRVERLQDISDDDIQAEGSPSITIVGDNTDTIEFKKSKRKNWWVELWNKTAPKGYRWEDNPYVFVYEFERVEG